ncbi:MAG: SpoIVB peptidase [Bacillota bacterium]|nr:SpoIVB peptidase [Bacillota bacterium]
MKKNRIVLLCWILAPIILLTINFYYRVVSIPQTIFIREGQKVTYGYLFQVKAEADKKNNSSIQTFKDRKAEVSLMGILPVKSVSLQSVPEITVYPGGQPIGIKLNTKGVLVVALSDIKTGNAKVSSPAVEAGVQIGDNILKVNNSDVISSEDLANKVNHAKNSRITLTIERDGEILKKSLVPVRSSTDSNYKIGLWVRDSTAGVGTLTFYDGKTKKFAALGHPITDVDTGSMLRVSKGNIINSSIISIRKGTKGNPGEVRGIFVNEETPMGTIMKNTQCGVYGISNKSLANKSFNKPLKIALRNEIKEGPAQILTTIDGEEPSLYSINIDKLLSQDSPGPKSMVIRVTDPKLLEKTGGIVQGMSGSPIIQNGKLVGAVTHVLINRPDVGYGIYIEWMLKDADILS